LTGVNLTTFLGTPPNAAGVSIRYGVIGGFGFTRYLFVNYNTAGPRTLVTLHYPGNAAHPVPALARLSGTGYSGVRIGALDHAIGGDVASSPASPAHTVAGVTAVAKAALFRKTT